jgi:hypothetical protein
VTEATYYRWRQEFGGLKLDGATTLHAWPRPLSSRCTP